VTQFDPFEPGFDAWPYDQYRRLREADPVHWSELLSGWVLTRYDDVDAILRDATISSDLDKAKPSPVVDLHRAREDREAMTLVLMDDPEHARIRKVLYSHFTARSIERLRESITARVDAALDELEGGRSMELIADFAYPLPTAVFCDLLGIPAEQGPQFGRWTAAVARSLDLVISEEDYAACMELLAEMEDYLSELAEAKRAAPTDDVLSALATSELTHAELVAQLITLYVAGHEPTTALIGNGMTALLDHPEQLARLQAEPERIPHAVLELLRYDGPNQFVRRVAVEPLRFDGADALIEPGDVVYVGVGGANHDPAQWGPSCDDLDIERPDAGEHVQFGGGVHHCLGSHLARLQAEVALTALLSRCPDLARGGPTEWSGRMTLRSVAAVPLSL
jgi:cytochrome P450